MSITITIYFLLNVIVLFVIGKISYFLKLVDIPSKRKIHTRPTAYTGGIAISLILLFAIIWFDTFDKSMSLILSSAFLISIVGFIDDKYTLNIGGKLSLQIIPIIYLIFFENLNLHQIGNYNFFYADLGTFSIPFTLLSLLFLINAFNYFDGIDGTLGFTTISVFAILYFLTLKHNDHYLVTVLNVEIFLLSISIPIIIFLLFNFSYLNLPKLFLGDSGSLLLGFIVSFILIYFANQNFIHPILLAWSVVIFVYEFLAINTIRILKRKKLLVCHNCNSQKVEKSLMAPQLINSQKKQNKDLDIIKYKDVKKTIKDYQKFIKENFKYVGENFAYEARSVHYDKKNNTKGIYGNASKKDLKELKEEGIEAQMIPWIEDKDN